MPSRPPRRQAQQIVAVLLIVVTAVQASRPPEESIQPLPAWQPPLPRRHDLSALDVTSSHLDSSTLSRILRLAREGEHQSEGHTPGDRERDGVRTEQQWQHHRQRQQEDDGETDEEGEDEEQPEQQQFQEEVEEVQPADGASTEAHEERSWDLPRDSPPLQHSSSMLSRIETEEGHRRARDMQRQQRTRPWLAGQVQRHHATDQNRALATDMLDAQAFREDSGARPPPDADPEGESSDEHNDEQTVQGSSGGEGRAVQAEQCCCTPDQACQPGSLGLTQPNYDVFAPEEDDQTEKMCCRFNEWVSSECPGSAKRVSKVFCEMELKPLPELLKQSAHPQEDARRVKELEAKTKTLEKKLDEQSFKTKDEAITKLKSDLEKLQGEKAARQEVASTSLRSIEEKMAEIREKIRLVASDYLMHKDKMDDLQTDIANVLKLCEDKLATTVDFGLAQANAVHRRNRNEHLRALAREESLITNSSEDIIAHEQTIRTLQAAIQQDNMREQKLNEAQDKYQELVPLIPGEEELYMNASKLVRGAEVDSDVLESIIANALKVHRRHAAEHKTALAAEERALVDAQANMKRHHQARATLKSFIEEDTARGTKLQEAAILLNDIRRIVGGEENEDQHTELSRMVGSMRSSARHRHEAT